MDARINRVRKAATIALFGLAGPAASATLIDLAIEPADITIFGEAASDNVGVWTLAVGDVNGDGNEDLLAVACNSKPLGGTRAGTLYIFWGNEFWQPGTTDLAADPPGVSRIFGKPGGDVLACNVASGDFNRDGYDDIVWGQPLTSDQASWAGKAYIIFGSPSFPDTLDLHTQSAGVVTVYGNVPYGTVGRSACACDVDGDSYEDIVLTAPGMEYSEVLMIRGREVFPSTFNAGQSEPGMIRIVDDIPNANILGVACGDVDSDGSGDLLLGALGAGRLVLLYGSPALSAIDSVLLAEPVVPVKVVLGQYSQGLGFGVSIADLNGDSQQDLIAGDIGADPLGCYDCGEVYVLYDADALPDTVDLATTTVAMTRVVGFGSSTKHGFRVLCEDLTGDSINDLVVTNQPLNVRATTSFLLGRTFMPTTILLATESGPITKITEATLGDELGEGVAALDLNGDALKDLMLSAHDASPLGRNWAGILYGFTTTTITTAVPSNGAPAFTLTNYPNPFADRTTFYFGDVQRGTVELWVYDVGGRRVFEAIVENHRGGALEFVWNGRDERGNALPSGVYFCKARIGSITLTRKLVLVR